MKLVCVTLFALLALAAANYSEQEYQFLFTKWATEHNKVYHHDAFFSRFNNFKQNLDKITLHNKGNHSFSMAMNEFGDLSFEEFHDKYTGYVPRARHFARGLNTAPKMLGAALDDAVDWVAKGAVTPVKNQGQCGSCWAFSATGSMEGAWFLKNGDLVSLSEQQLVDCSKDFGNQGCNGGLMDDAFEYAIKNGMCQEDAYPYKAADGTCAKTCESVVSFSGFKDVTPNDEEALKQAVALGPVSVAIEADQQVFQFYSGGVLSDSGCGTQLDHGVLVVGYGTDNGQAYWKVKNSWGGSWGEQGYIRLARGSNECGISADPSYPIANKKQ